MLKEERFILEGEVHVGGGFMMEEGGLFRRGEVHGGKFMMEEGRFMLEGEVHIEGGEVHVGGGGGSWGEVYDGGGEVHVEGGRGSRWRRGVSCWRMVEFLLGVGGIQESPDFGLSGF